MDGLSAAAEILGVTPSALNAALDRGETVASLARECGLDVGDITESVVDAEVSDVEALAPIAGFGAADIDQFVRELAAYLREFVARGQRAADAMVDGRALVPAY